MNKECRCGDCHYFRSGFCSWMREQSEYPPEVLEGITFKVSASNVDYCPGWKLRVSTPPNASTLTEEEVRAQKP